jgi:hypothetical protein
MPLHVAWVLLQVKFVFAQLSAFEQVKRVLPQPDSLQQVLNVGEPPCPPGHAGLQVILVISQKD